jgi:hypothetical protein
MTQFIIVLTGKVGGLYGIPSVKKKVPYLICSAQNEVRWIPLLSNAKKLQVPKKGRKILIIWATVSFWKRLYSLEFNARL